MFAAPKTTTLPQNLPRTTSGTKTLFRFAPKRHKPCLLIVSSELRSWRDRAGSIRRVGTIKMVAIAASAAPSLRAPPRLLGSTQPRPRLKIIVAATNQHVGKIGTWARTPVTTITRKPIFPINALSLASQKTSIGLGDFFVGDGC